MAKGKKTGGRKAGTPNRTTAAARIHVENVIKLLGKTRQDQRGKPMTLAKISVELLTCGIPAVIQKELEALRGYVYTRPKVTVEVGTKAGAPLPVNVIWDIPAGAKARDHFASNAENDKPGLTD